MKTENHRQPSSSRIFSKIEKTVGEGRERNREWNSTWSPPHFVFPRSRERKERTPLLLFSSQFYDVEKVAAPSGWWKSLDEEEGVVVHI